MIGVPWHNPVPGHSPWPPPPLTIQVVIDSVALLSGIPAQECVFLFDDGKASSGVGSLSLVSSVSRGQLVNWAVMPLDLQAPGWISGITFDADQPPATDSPAVHGPAWSLAWGGIVPDHAVPGQVYPYRLHLTFADCTAEPVELLGPALQIAGGPTATAGQADDRQSQFHLPPLRDSGDVL